MLSLFPSLFTWSFLGIAFLRVVLALAIGTNGLTRLKLNWPNNIKMSAIAGLEVLVAIFLLIGLFTQAAALIAAILTVVCLATNYKTKGSDFIMARVLIIALSLSLLVLGPGAYAIDWPL